MDTQIDVGTINQASEEIQTRRLPEDYFYSEFHQEKELKDSSISGSLGKYH